MTPMPEAAGPKLLRVGAALPDPPFELTGADGPEGFDIELMQLIAQAMGRTWQLVPYTGSDFNGIFAGLDSGAYDCVASGTTITSQRQQAAPEHSERACNQPHVERRLGVEVVDFTPDSRDDHTATVEHFERARRVE